jgi:hypothetical protein
MSAVFNFLSRLNAVGTPDISLDFLQTIKNMTKLGHFTVGISFFVFIIPLVFFSYLNLFRLK